MGQSFDTIKKYNRKSDSAKNSIHSFVIISIDKPKILLNNCCVWVWELVTPPRPNNPIATQIATLVQYLSFSWEGGNEREKKRTLFWVGIILLIVCFSICVGQAVNEFTIIFHYFVCFWFYRCIINWKQKCINLRHIENQLNFLLKNTTICSTFGREIAPLINTQTHTRCWQPASQKMSKKLLFESRIRF